MSFVEACLAIGVPAVGVIVWAVRIEGRVALNEQQIVTMRDDLRYIRSRIDRALNGND